MMAASSATYMGFRTWRYRPAAAARRPGRRAEALYDKAHERLRCRGNARDQEDDAQEAQRRPAR